MTRLLPGLLAALAVAAVGGCSALPFPAAPEAPPPAVDAPLPAVTVRPGSTAVVDVSRYAPVAVDPPPGLDVDVSADGWATVRVGDGFRGLALVPFTSGGERYAIAVQHPAGAGALDLRRLGLRAEDPTVLELALRQRGVDGREVALTVDEDTGIVLLVGDRIGSETAVDFDPETQVVGVDLDVTGAGAHRLRVAARADGLVSNWIEVVVVDGRLAE